MQHDPAESVKFVCLTQKVLAEVARLEAKIRDMATQFPPEPPPAFDEPRGLARPEPLEVQP